MESIPDLESLVKAIDGFGRARVFVVGDVMIDHYVYGSAQRISPEAPIPVLRQEDRRTMMGGAGNVAMNLLSYGAAVSLCGLTGEDENAGRLRDICAQHPGLAVRFIADSSRVTTVKTRFVAQSQQLLRLDEETPHAAGQAAEDDVIAACIEEIAGADVVVLSDYAKGMLTPSVCRRVISAAREAGKPVLVDPKRRDLSVYAGASLVSPNLKEMEEVTGLHAGDNEQAARACRQVLETHDFAAVLLTRGEAGMSLMKRGEDDALHIRTRAQGVFDVSGAGDTVIATVAAGLAAGLDLAGSVELANRAAGLVVAKPGTGTVSRRELRQALGAVAVRHPYTLEEALERVQVWRDLGKTIGFSNGCFDLLHDGHLQSLEEAKRHCDVLVVGVNSDRSATRLKGPGRPVQNQMTRARVLSSLEFCDLAIVFDEETPLALIEALKPDILVKGEDYAEKDIVGAELVRANGGRIVRVPLLPGHSTTGTISRLRASRED